MKKRLVFVAMALLSLSVTAFAADNLPLNGQKGVYAGVEVSTNYMHVETKPSVNKTYTVATPAIAVTAGYGTELYQIGVFGDAGSQTVKGIFDQFGDAKGTVPIFGINAKVVPIRIGQFKAGLVSDVKYVGKGTGSVDMSWRGYPTNLRFDTGPLWVWSTGMIAQYQPCKYFAVYAGEKYEDLAAGKATMTASTTIGLPVKKAASMTYSSALTVHLRETDNFSTVAGVVIAPSKNVSVIVQGRYTESVPMSFLASAEYRF